jgi:CRP-like cAMP-binding protein
MDVLKQLHQDTGLSLKQLGKIKLYLREKQFNIGENFVRSGEPTEVVGLVVRGIFRFYYLTYDGKEVTKSFCSEGEFIGAYGALLTHRPSSYTVEALEDCHVITIPFSLLEELSQDSLDWLLVRLRVVEQLYLKKEQRERQLLLYDAMSRYKQFLDAYPTYESRIRKYHIASYLGISPVSLSRIRSQLSTDRDTNGN